MHMHMDMHIAVPGVPHPQLDVRCWTIAGRKRARRIEESGVKASSASCQPVLPVVNTASQSSASSLSTRALYLESTNRYCTVYCRYIPSVVYI